MRALLLAATLAALPAAAQPPPLLAAGELLEGRFAQERIVPGLGAPLLSEGRFALVPGRGMVWHVERPVIAATAITPDGLIQSVDGGEPTRIPAERIGFLARLPLMLATVLAGDWGPIEAAFAVERADDGAGWGATLTPRASGTPITKIVVRGGALVDAIEVQRRDGGEDRLTFSDQTPRAGPPSDADEALLAAAAR